MAAGILLIVVVAVTGAIVAGQQQALDAQNRIAGVIAAEELIGRLMIMDYDELASWDGYKEENVGEMIDVNGDPFPSSFGMIRREVMVSSPVQRMLPGLDVTLMGRNVYVWAFDADGSLLVELYCFVPQPASQTVPEDDDDGDDDDGPLSPFGLGSLLGGILQ